MTLKPFRQFIAETSLSRVWQYMQDDGASIGIISAFKKDAYETTARYQHYMQKTAELGSDIRSAGYGYSLMDGHYTMNQGVFKDHPKPVDEPSLCMVGRDEKKLRADIIQWGNRYEQESVLFKPAGDPDAYLIYMSGRIEKAGTFHPNRLGDYYTRMVGRPGTFAFG